MNNDKMADSTGSFKDLDFPRVLDTTTVDFVEDFYVPLLSRAETYKRGVGFFSSSWIRSAARGLSALASNGGKAYWLTSPELSVEDWEAFKRGSKARRNRILYDSLQDTISDLETALEQDTRNALAWMIADNLLEIKLCVPSESPESRFHDKFGVAVDESGNKVAFHGSLNDSATSLDNYEAYSIDCNWLGPRDAEGVDSQESRFDDLWKGENPGVNTYSIPEGTAEEIISLRDDNGRPYSEPVDAMDDGRGSHITLREYQEEAVDRWIDNNSRGILQMATGTGKTITALAALDEYLKQHPEPVLVVFAVPVTHLAEQWSEELESYGYPTPKKVYGTANKDWKSDLSRITSNVTLGIRDREYLLTTHKTLSDPFLTEKVSEADATKVLIGDEVHGLGSNHHQTGLLEAYDARLGLSATPRRFHDEEGTSALLEYFGDIVFEYTLSDAIPQYLTPYDYHPVIVEMDEEELAEYRNISRSIAAAMSGEETDQEAVERLSMKRANLVKSASDKYQKLRKVLHELDDPHHLLVYTNPEQIEEVQGILNEEGILQHKFTYEEGQEQRQQLLDNFAKGEYQALVAMRCLDEGVNVPATETAILMSNSTNKKQFIQRRGRVLRKSPGKEKAIIYDMIVVPTLNPDRELVTSEQSILKKELRRFEEFAGTARNEHEARNTLDRIRTKYEL